MIPAVVAAWEECVSDFERAADPIREEAQRRGLIEPGLDFLDSLLAADVERAHRGLMTDRLRRYIEESELDFVIRLQAAQDSLFEIQAAEITRRAALESWSAAKYEAAIVALGDDFGAGGLAGRYASTWFRTYVENMCYHRAQTRMLSITPVHRLFPMMKIRTQDDGRVRPAHALAAKEVGVRPWDWPGWSNFTPPFPWDPWNCRCRRILVSATEIGS